MKSEKYFEKRKLSIVLTGIPPGANFAYCARISNFEDQDVKLQKQRDFFIVNTFVMPLLTGGIFYMPSGVSLNADEYNRLEQLPDIVHNHGVNHAARYLIALQRRVSLRTNVVGQDSMVDSIPAAPTNPHVVMSDTLSTDIHDVNPNFSYVQPHSFSPQRLAPMVAGNGNVVTMTGWGDEQGNQQVSMKFLLTPETPTL